MAVINVVGESLFQWDTGIKVFLSLPSDTAVKRVDFESHAITGVMSMKVSIEEGRIVSEVPNEMLQYSEDITAYVVISHSGDEERTIFRRTFEVEPKEKPPGYVCDQQEVLRFESLEKRIKALEENGGTNVDLSKYVKNTDYATASEAGVVIIKDSTYGLKMDNSKELRVALASTKDIDTKSGNRPIGPSAIDYAVKSGMTTNALDWTDDEKQAARDLIEAEKKETWTTIQDITLEEDVNAIEVTTDMDGNTFKAKKMRLMFLGITTNARLNLYSNPGALVDTRNMQNTYFYNAFAANSFTKCLIEIGERLENGTCKATCRKDQNEMESSYILSTYDYCALPTRDQEYLDRIKMSLNGADFYFSAGTRILIEGVLE